MNMIVIMIVMLYCQINLKLVLHHSCCVCKITDTDRQKVLLEIKTDTFHFMLKVSGAAWTSPQCTRKQRENALRYTYIHVCVLYLNLM